MSQKIFTVTLTGDQETPPNASAASGSGTITWDTVANTATYTFTVNGLDFGPALGLAPQTASTADDVTGMHFHNGAPGMAGPVAFGQLNPAQDADDFAGMLNADGSWTVQGVWGPNDPANASILNFAPELTSATPGSSVSLYWNVHTAAFPMGEIRGQLVAADTVG